jgi:hypothetical protein
MMAYHKQFDLNHHQRGATLLVALIMLTVATLIAIYAMKSTTFQLKMSANERLESQSFWYAKGLLDTQYEFNLLRANLEQSIFQQAISAQTPGAYVEYKGMSSNPVELFDFEKDPDGKKSPVEPPELKFSVAATPNAVAVPDGNDPSVNTAGFEMLAEATLGVSRSRQVYGVTIFGFQNVGSLVE